MKILFGFFAGFASAAAVAYFLFFDFAYAGEFYDHEVGGRRYQYDPKPNYNFNSNSLLGDSYAPETGLDSSDFQLVRQTHLMTISPEAIKHLCFFVEDTYQAGLTEGLRLSIFLTPESQKQYLSTLRANIDHPLAFTFRDGNLGLIIPRARTLENAEEGLLPADEEKPTKERWEQEPEIHLYSQGYDVREMIAFAKFLSPTNMPEACPNSKDLNEIVWWNHAYQKNWSPEALAWEKEASEIVDQIFEPASN